MLGVVYTLWPVDLIPDVLGPVGWVDDLAALGLTCAWAAWSYWRLRRTRAAAGTHPPPG